MKKKILGIMLIIAIMLVVIIPITYASEEPVTIDLNTLENIFISPTGYCQEGEYEISYTGTYNITGEGSYIVIENDSNSEVTFDISLDEVVLYDGIHIWGYDAYDAIVLNIKIYGDTYIGPGFKNYNTGSTTVNISIENGALYLPTGLYTGEDMNVDISADNLCIDEENIDDINYEVYRNGHEAGTTVIENEVEATTENEGSYDEVVYCQVCREELSRTTVEVTYVIDETDDGDLGDDELLADDPTAGDDVTAETSVEEVTEVKTENETTSNPTTGDTIVVFAVVFVIAVAGIVVTIKMRKKAK